VGGGTEKGVLGVEGITWGGGGMGGDKGVEMTVEKSREASEPVNHLSRPT
jgi:hypothetical protein